MRIIACTMGYNRIPVIRKSLEAFYRTCGELPHIHVMAIQYYPLPKRNQHRLELIELAREFRMEIFDQGFNAGYHETQNAIIDKYCDQPGDILLNYDPDSMAMDQDWIRGLRMGFESDPSLAVLGLVNPCIERELAERGFTSNTFLNGLEIKYPKTAGVLSLAAWSADFVKRVGGLQEPRSLYGGIEAAMWPIIKKNGRSWGYLPQYRESTDLSKEADPEYTEWKLQHGHLDIFKGDFDSFLRKMGKIK
jgi:hypothetical protein